MIEKTKILDRWLDPGNVIALAKGLGVLFLLALGGYVWLMKLEWKVDEEISKSHEAAKAIQVHEVEAENWKRRILALENQMLIQQNIQQRHQAQDAHDKQGRTTVKIESQIDSLRSAVQRLESEINSMQQSRSPKHPALMATE